MKSFLQLVEEKEQTHRPVVMAFGRMNPPTTGHLKLIDKVRELAAERNAEHEVIVSHSHDAKKNPLSVKDKLKHLKRYSPGTNFTNSSKEQFSILQQASRLHAQGHDHLIMVAGSDRVEEYKKLLKKYDGVPGTHGHYKFKKIEVISAGQRDPDADKEEDSENNKKDEKDDGVKSMSGTKMRKYAGNKDFSSFRKGVPKHVSDAHAKELMQDVRKGMGINEQVNRGLFKAIFVTGGPGSGKDIIIREAIAEQKAVEINIAQAFDYLNDKQKLSEESKEIRREAIRNRSPLIVNATADNADKVLYVKEELEELGYYTMMVFVNTTNEISKQRNENLTRTIAEEIRQDKWQKAQHNIDVFYDKFNDFNIFDNNDNLEVTEYKLTDIYEHTKVFLDIIVNNDIAVDWLTRNNKLNINEQVSSLFEKEMHHAKKDSKSIQKHKNRFIRDSNSPIMQVLRKAGKIDDVRDGDVKGSSSYTFRTYEESKPTLKVSPIPKEPNFRKDKDKEARLKKKQSDSPTQNQRIRNTGIGPEFDTRQQGTVYAMSGLGDVTYREETDKYKEDAAGGIRSFRQYLEAIDDPGAVDMGVGGTLGGASNKEPLETIGNKFATAGLTIKKKKKNQEK